MRKPSIIYVVEKSWPEEGQRRYKADHPRFYDTPEEAQQWIDGTIGNCSPGIRYRVRPYIGARRS